MASVDDLRLVDHQKWIPGFTNLLLKENRSWWRTRKWWVNILAWTVIINGFLAMMLWVVPATDPEEIIAADEAMQIFFTIFGAFATIGVIVIAQGTIVGEKQTGTAEWVMSNPVSSAAFILSKLFGNATGIFVIIVLLQSLLFYGQLSLRGGELLPIGPVVAATALISLALVFFLTLTIMLGAIFGSRGPVVGIALAIFIGQDIAAGLLGEWIPWFPKILPQRLYEFATGAVAGQPLPSTTPLIVAAVLSVLFVMIAIWRFGREEY
jgi:ABC-2 type transport system permease protein